MLKNSNVNLTITFNDPELNFEDREEEALRLLNQMKDLDEVEVVKRIRDPSPPEGNKSLGGILVGVLTAEVKSANIKSLFSYLGTRLSGKPIEMEVEANGKKLKIIAHNREELVAAIEAAQEFVGA